MLQNFKVTLTFIQNILMAGMFASLKILLVPQNQCPVGFIEDPPLRSCCRTRFLGLSPADHHHNHLHAQTTPHTHTLSLCQLQTQTPAPSSVTQGRSCASLPVAPGRDVGPSTCPARKVEGVAFPQVSGWPPVSTSCLSSNFFTHPLPCCQLAHPH